MQRRIVHARAIKLSPEDTVEFTTDDDPCWRETSDGWRLKQACLWVRPATVADVLALGALFNPPLRYKTLNHFRWWITHGSIKINGKLFTAT
jgi:hypothetical protein